MKLARPAIVTILSVSLGQLALAQGHMHHEERPSRSAEAIAGPAAPYSSYPTPFIDARGRLWLAFNEGQHVYVTSSTDQGKTFARAVRVNAAPEKMDANGEGRPKIAVRDDSVFVSWTQKGERPFTGFIRFARSADCGKTFSAPVTVNDDGIVTGHRFDTLGLGPKGEVVIAWIDKRDLELAKQKGGAYEGAAVYYAVSRDGGKSFEANKKLKDSSCECCRMAIAFEPDGTPVLLWRDIFAGSIRDHAVARLDGSGTVRRASFDGWKIQGCPHHGPSLAVGADGVYHMAWFTGEGLSGPGVFYARSDDKGQTVSKAVRFGPSVASTGRPTLLTRGRDVLLAWKESGQEGGSVKLARSSDGGRSWSAPQSLVSTAEGSDHPLLTGDGKTAFLSWYTEKEGYRLVAVP